MDFDENHVDLGTLPVFTLANLAANMTTLLPNKSYRSKINAKTLAKKMDAESVTRAICSPALMAKLLKYSDLQSLACAYLGGGPVYPGVLEKVRKEVDLHIVYGSTEAEPISGVHWADVCEEDRQKIALGEGILVGEIVKQITCKIGDANEILVSGETVLSGYLGGVGDADNKIREDGTIWHRTGDAGYIDEKGRLWLLGRVSQTINDEIGTLYPFCIECILDAQFGIRGAVITKNSERVIVIQKADAKVGTNKILEALKPYKITKVITVKKMPMDKRHDAKIDYEKLRERVL